jgi:hypothetical protein
MSKKFIHLSDIKFKRIVGSAAIEGVVLDKDDSATVQMVASGKLSVDDAKVKIISKYRKKSSPTKTVKKGLTLQSSS